MSEQTEGTMQKISGWAGVFKANGVPRIIVVSAQSREDAVAKLEEAGHVVCDRSQIRPVTLLRGHDVAGEKFEWEEASLVKSKEKP